MGALWAVGSREVADVVPEVGHPCTVIGTLHVMADHEQATCFSEAIDELTSDWTVLDIRAVFSNPAETVSMERIDSGSEAWASRHAAKAHEVDRPAHRAGQTPTTFGWFSYTSPHPERDVAFWLDLQPWAI